MIVYHPTRRLAYTIGLPGSGKTTLARELIAQHPTSDAVRVNRDDLRTMLYGPDVGRWGDPHIESQITEAQRAAITAAWRTGARLVVCDDTNLNPAHRTALAQLAMTMGAHVEEHDLRGVPLATCLERNARRAQSVPDKVIRDMHTRWIAPGLPLPLSNDRRRLLEQVTDTIDSFGNSVIPLNGDLIADKIVQDVIEPLLAALRADNERLEREVSDLQVSESYARGYDHGAAVAMRRAARFLNEVLEHFHYGTTEPVSERVRSAPILKRTVSAWLLRLDEWQRIAESFEGRASSNRPDPVQ